MFLNTLFILDIKQWEQIETWLLQSDVQEDLLLDVQAVEWENVFQENDINPIFDSFYPVMTTTIDKHAPLKKPSRKIKKLI